jgi:hypothetical protein
MRSVKSVCRWKEREEEASVQEEEVEKETANAPKSS